MAHSNPLADMVPTDLEDPDLVQLVQSGSKEALELLGTGAADAMVETFAQLDELLLPWARACGGHDVVDLAVSAYKEAEADDAPADGRRRNRPSHSRLPGAPHLRRFSSRAAPGKNLEDSPPRDARRRTPAWPLLMSLVGVRDDFRNWLAWACGTRNAMKIGAAQ
jgi:hypothetical protein